MTAATGTASTGTAPPEPTSAGTAFTGTGRLLRLGIRRDRVVLTVWVVAIGLLVVASVASIVGLYGTAQEREAAAAFAAANRLARAFDGPASGTSVGALTMMEAFGVLAVLVGLMSIQMMVRHTRQDEELGRADLIGSTVVGHHARLAAAVLVTTVANLLIGITAAVALLAQGLPVAGSLLAGAALVGVGLTFGAIAAVSAQLAETQRAATALAGVALGAAFLLRAVGDAAGTVADGGVELVSAWPSWLSPIGWGQQVRAFGGDQVEVLALFGVAIVSLLAAAGVIASRRDVGGAVLATRPGPAAAPGKLAGPLRLAWRLQRGALLGWMLGVAVLAGALGSLGDGAEELVGLSDELAAAFEQMAAGGSLVDAYLAFVMGIVGIIAAAYGVSTVLRARAEESSERLEPLLATGVSRTRWLGAYGVIAAGGALVVLLVPGAVAGLSYGAATGEFAEGLTGFLGAGSVQWPAVIAVIGVTIAMVGAFPRLAAGVGWTLVAGSFALGQLGDLLGLRQEVMNLSPFTHVPMVPADRVEVLPLALLLIVGGGMIGLGLAAFRRRDLQL